MKKIHLLLSFSLLLMNTLLKSQTFKNLVDDSGNDSPVQAMDGTKLSVAFDHLADSVWFKIESSDSITSAHDWGFYIWIDSDSDTTNGKAAQAYNDTSFRYDLYINFVNNKFFPPTNTILFTSSDSLLSTSIAHHNPDVFTLVLSVPLSLLGGDTLMHLKAATGSFDNVMWDNLPDSGYVVLKADSTADTGTTALPNFLSEPEVILYPNPAQDLVLLQVKDTKTQLNLQLLDITGRIVWQTTTIQNAQHLQIDLSAYKDGLYFLQAVHGHRKSTQKLIIRK